MSSIPRRLPYRPNRVAICSTAMSARPGSSKTVLKANSVWTEHFYAARDSCRGKSLTLKVTMASALPRPRRRPHARRLDLEDRRRHTGQRGCRDAQPSALCGGTASLRWPRRPRRRRRPRVRKPGCGAPMPVPAPVLKATLPAKRPARLIEFAFTRCGWRACPGCGWWRAR
jgi:hypothetical protein